MSGVDKAIEAIGGNVAELARRLGIRRQAITQWKASGVVPVGRVLDVERETGVARHVLNPRFYPAPASKKRRRS